MENKNQTHPKKINSTYICAACQCKFCLKAIDQRILDLVESYDASIKHVFDDDQDIHPADRYVRDMEWVANQHIIDLIDKAITINRYDRAMKGNKF